MEKTDRIYTDVNEALEHIYSERVRFVALAVRYVGSREAAEDIFQGCTVNLMRAMKGRGKSISNLDAYFAFAVKNRCRN